MKFASDEMSETRIETLVTIVEPQTIYLDQNALVYLFEESLKSAEFDKKLVQAIRDGQFKTVLSAWHWAETAQTHNLGKALPLAEFMDRLQPGWLRDRRHLSRTEVEEKFFQFTGITYTRQPAVVTLPELLSEMHGFRILPEKAPSSRDFVEGWITNPEFMRPVIESHKKNMQALIDLREALAQGKVTPAMMKEGDRKYIERHLPETTPGGVVLDTQTKNAFLDKVTQTDFATLAIESEIAEYSWSNRGRVDWNSMIDKFHLISSVHYTDVVVSDDRYFYLLLPCAQKTGYAHAMVLKFRDFRASFLS